MKKVCWYKNDSFSFLEESGHIISIVGAGGKTTLMYELADLFQKRGLRTAVITTTKIYKPDFFCQTMTECRKCWEEGKYAVCGQEFSKEKLMVPQPEFLEQILTEAENVLIEADGAAGKACKVPAEHEPVILPQSDIVIGVMGLDALHKPIKEKCFRHGMVADVLQCKEEHCLNGADMTHILLSEQGTRKNVGERDYYIVLNKCDDSRSLNDGKDIVERLERHGHKKVVLRGYLQK